MRNSFLINQLLTTVVVLAAMLTTAAPTVVLAIDEPSAGAKPESIADAIPAPTLAVAPIPAPALVPSAPSAPALAPTEKPTNPLKRETAFRSFFERKRREAWGCYEKALQADPLVRGNVTLKLEVSSEGRVERASLERPEIHNEDFQRCLVDLSKTWTFDDILNGETAVTVRHTYAFIDDPSLAPIASPKLEPRFKGSEDL